MDTILFGKYQLIRVLGQGRSGTVYLAMHLELEEYRAIKQVSRSCTEYQQFRREALLLKRLRHPGIPIVYDLQEDEDFSYLIEEFISGDSFYEIIQKKGSLKQDVVIRYGIQLCALVDYLHSAEEIPILHLDLQPRNLILCHEQVKLLDFEHAGTSVEVNRRAKRYGTPGFCAPEQRQDGELGVHTDVYQIGAVLAYLLTGSLWQEQTEEIGGDLGKIIRRCLRFEGDGRYLSAGEVGQELQDVYTKRDMSDDRSISLILAFAGTRAGSGVTHLALGAGAYLNQRGYPCLYEEHNRSGDVRALASWLGREMDAYGLCRNFGVPMKPWYGEAVRLPEHGYEIVVRDYGDDWNAAGEMVKTCSCGVLFLVSGGKWWQQEQAIAVKRRLETGMEPASDKLKVIFNQAIPEAVGSRWKLEQEHSQVTCLKSPYFPDPFRLTDGAERFFEALYRWAVDTVKAKPVQKRLTGRGRTRFWDSFVRNWEEQNMQKRKRRSSELWEQTGL